MHHQRGEATMSLNLTHTSSNIATCRKK